ncbi:MAG: GGDEF domain-containing protein [Chloroflexi bacterium]|nr:GGDEF domain-containing protein [Chloroflexota bacterium]
MKTDESLWVHGRKTSVPDGGAAPAPGGRVTEPREFHAAFRGLARALAACASLDDVAQTAQEHLTALLSGGHRRASVQVLLGVTEALPADMGAAEANAAGRAMTAGVPAVWPERPAHGGVRDPARAWRGGVALPLLHQDVPVGVALCGRLTRQLTEDDRAALMEIGGLVGSAVGAALQRQRAEMELKATRALLRVAEQFLATTTPAEVATVAVGAMLAAGGRRAALIGRDAAELTYRPLAVGGASDEEAAALAAARLRVGFTPLLDEVWAAQESRSATAEAVRQGLPQRVARRWRPTALLAAPLVVEGRSAGLLVAEPPLNGCSGAWLGMAQSIAAQTATALDRAQRFADLEALALTDPLTGIGNQRALLADLGHECARLGQGGVLAVLMLDVDFFKAYNDRHGHVAGDRALRKLAQTLRGSLRSGDRVYRYGGEEFTALLRVRQRESGQQIAERLRRQVERAFSGGATKLTVSCGVALAPYHGGSAAELLTIADHALYQAKERGRNQVAFAAFDEAPRVGAATE